MIFVKPLATLESSAYLSPTKFYSVIDLDIVNTLCRFDFIDRHDRFTRSAGAGRYLTPEVHILYPAKPPSLGQASNSNLSFHFFQPRESVDARMGDFTGNNWASSSGRGCVDGIGFTAVTNELGSNPAVRVVLSIPSSPLPDVIGIRLRFLHRKPLALTLRGMRLVKSNAGLS